MPHLAQGVFPVLLGLLAWPGPGGTAAPRAAAIRAVLLLAIGLVVVGPVRPGTASRVGTPWPETRIGRDTLRIAPSTAADLAMVRHHVGPHAPGTRDVLVAPNWIGMYPALDLRAPVWEIYMLFPANERRQRAEIRRMEDAGVRLAIVRDGAFDGREARRFRNTHPLLQAWLDDGFRVVARERSAVVYVRDDEALPGPAK